MSHDDRNNFLTGILIGGILGGAAGLLTAPKSGQDLRDDIADTYCDLKDKTLGLTEQFKKTSHSVLDRFGNGYHHNSHQPYSFLSGSALGAVLGATAAFILAPKSGARLRKDLGDKYEEIRDKAEDFIAEMNHKGHGAFEQIEDWKETVTDILDKISSKKRSSGSKVEDVVEWAGLGLRLLQQLQKRR